MKIDIRPIKPAEIEAASKLVPEGYDAPEWSKAIVITDDDVLVGLLSIETILIAEPLYLSPNYHKKGLVLSNALCWLDGFMRLAARAVGVNKWLAFVSDDHSKFQELVKKHMPVTFYRERPGLWFTRRF